MEAGGSGTGNTPLASAISQCLLVRLICVSAQNVAKVSFLRTSHVRHRPDHELCRPTAQVVKTLFDQRTEELAQTKTALAQKAQELAMAQLAQTKTELLARTKAQLCRCELEQARATDRRQHELVAIREQIGQLFIVPPAAPEDLAAPPQGSATGCKHIAEARFAVVAMRGLAESGPSAQPPAPASSRDPALLLPRHVIPLPAFLPCVCLPVRPSDHCGKASMPWGASHAPAGHPTGRSPRGGRLTWVRVPARVDAAATFAVDPERAFPARHFRVLMTGPSPNGEHYLLLSGFEDRAAETRGGA
ncbi:hypothetical protein PAPYR_9165 [Paratrimastix pyriformis]|uniref:Uncharacterized protein n=1 Tax=Paratrimastix pyriformis TaxID=342808 RepID=A0ABQ8U926_9EUKA|nr:hypothetical protein PAPYR_9165 [Paratrimastix pyriformis]